MDLESALHVEQRSLDEGRAEGRKIGQQDGWLEGRSLGIERGFLIGQELGLYRGSIRMLRQLAERQSDLLVPRVDQKLTELANLLDAYPRTDPLDQSLDAKMAEIRSKFKVLMSSLGALSAYFPKSASTTDF